MTNVVLITGASRGIGRAAALRLARDFDCVALVARTAGALEATADQIRQSGGSAFPMALDLRDAEACSQAVMQTLQRFGRLDALVCVAGAVPQSDIFTLTDADWAEGFSLKFHSARRLTLAAWDALKASGGSVVITSGTSALTPKASLAAVGTINAAIVALAKAFADQGVKDGIQVNSVLPGPVLTDRRRSMLERYAQERGLPLTAAMEQFAAEAGIARYGVPEDIANAVAFLVSPASRWLTGGALRVDGGETKAV